MSVKNGFNVEYLNLKMTSHNNLMFALTPINILPICCSLKICQYFMTLTINKEY